MAHSRVEPRLPASLFEGAYGNWVGPTRSAGRETFGVWDRLTTDDLGVQSIDTWDEAGRQHDVAYDQAQREFIDDLNDLGMPASEAVKRYLRALTEADRVITDAAAKVTASGTTGAILRRGSQVLFPVKVDAHDRIIDQIENNSDYRQSIDASDRTAVVDHFGSVKGIMAEDGQLRGRENERIRNLGGDGPVPEPAKAFRGFVSPKDGVITGPLPSDRVPDY